MEHNTYNDDADSNLSKVDGGSGCSSIVAVQKLDGTIHIPSKLPHGFHDFIVSNAVIYALVSAHKIHVPHEDGEAEVIACIVHESATPDGNLLDDSEDLRNRIIDTFVLAFSEKGAMRLEVLNSVGAMEGLVGVERVLGKVPQVSDSRLQLHEQLLHALETHIGDPHQQKVHVRAPVV